MTDGIPYLVIEDLLPQREHDRLLAYAQSEPERYAPATLRNYGKIGFDPGIRVASAARYGLGPYRRPLEAAVLAILGRIIAALRIAPFEPMFETELVAHRHGGFFGPHVDTLRDLVRRGRPVERLITTVYYLHAKPRRFSGGELVLFPEQENAEPILLEPRDNRLVVFPSRVTHEVLPVDCPGNALVDARFSVNCWLLGPRDEG